MSQEAKKILIVAESIDVNDSSGTKGRVALIHNLHKAGYKLLVLHYTQNDICLEEIDCFSIREKRKSFLFFLSRTERYFRKYLKISLHKPLENIFGFSFTLKNDRNSIISALKKFDGFQPDLVFTLSKGGSFRPHHALLKMPELHHKWAAYIHDPYPMHFYPQPYCWREPGALQKEKFVKAVSEKARFFVFPSALLRDWMGQHFKNFKEKGWVVPHQINEDESSSAFSRSILQVLDTSKFNLLHAGTLLDARDPQYLIEAFRIFLKKNKRATSNASLLLIGNAGAFGNYLKEKSLAIPQLYVEMNALDFEHVNQLQKKTSVNIILEARSNISPFLPGKFPHCIAANRPILHLGPFKSETIRLLGEDYPFTAEIDDVQKISRLISELYTNWEENQEQKLDRHDLEAYLSVEQLKERMDAIIAEV